MSEIAISVKDVKIRYRMMNKVSFFRALVSRSTYSKTKYFEEYSPKIYSPNSPNFNSRLMVNFGVA